MQAGAVEEEALEVDAAVAGGKPAMRDPGALAGAAIAYRRA